MKKIDEEISPQREELLKWILDDDTLEYVQEKYSGTLIRVESAYRTWASIAIKLKGEKAYYFIRYKLPEDEQSADLITETGWKESIKFRVDFPELWGLFRHRACEAMLSLRNVHKQHVKKLLKADT